MTLIRNLLGTNPVSGVEAPEAVSFRGTNSSYDKLGRSSDLSGNTNTKELTMSFWWYATTEGTAISFSGTYVRVEIFESGKLDFIGLGVGPTSVVRMYTADGIIPLNTWTHIAISIDLTSTGSRAIYVNDKSVSFTVDYYQNLDIKTSGANLDLAKSRPLAGATQGLIRMAHIFADYTYRDLSVTANRRLFIDSDGKPAEDQADLSPILYLPMTDAATAGSNSGTGGDFTVNGVLDTAGRAPNQFNCSASKFDSPSWSSGNDYLSKSSISGLTDGKKFTLSFVTRKDSNGNRQLLHFGNSNTIKFAIFHGYGSNTIYIRVYDTSSNIALNITGLPMIDGKIVHYTISVDMADTSKRFVYMNGESYAATYSTYTVNATLDFTWNQYQIGSGDDGSTQYWWDGSIGEFYFDTVYTDLSTDNPFWNSDTNKPKPVRQVISETGTTPLIALPLRADDAGNNLGSGGDFTVNSGPYTGARGGSEFWARSASLGPGYLSSTTSISNTTTLTMVFSFKTSYTGGISLFSNKVGSNYHANIGYRQAAGSPGQTLFSFRDSSHNDCVQFSIPDSSLAGIGKWNTIMFSVNSSNSSLYKVYVNGVAPSLSNVVASGASMKFSSATTYFAYYYGVQDSYDIGSLYLITSYIDFSQESNRNLFVDQLGYPKDLAPAIEAGDIAEPLIYMKFDDTSALGTNSGTGGDFTVNGTVTAGGDVDPNA